MLELRNPHSVLAALERRPADVLEVLLPLETARPAWRAVAELAERHGIPVRDRQGGRAGPRARPGRGTARPGDEGGRHGMAIARVKPRPDVGLDELFAGASGARAAPGGASGALAGHGVTGASGAPGPQGAHGLWLALDCVQDPHNLGAVFRSAAFFGVRGLLLTSDRSAPLADVAYDVASGGVEYVPHALPGNLDRALKVARAAGLWVLGAAEEAEQDVGEVPLDRSWLLVLGNEEQGLRRLTRESCDALCRLTPRGPLSALNVSAAGAVLMASLTRGGTAAG